MDTSVIIPAFNEESRIESTLRDLTLYLSSQPQSFEILVVDDGSTDGTQRLVEKLAGEIQGLRWISYLPNRGKGYAVRTGMLNARGSIRVMCDADGSMAPTQLAKLTEPIRRGSADMVLGSRYVSGSEVAVAQPLWRRVWSRLANWVVRHHLVNGVLDTSCGYKALSGALAELTFSRAQVDGWAFDLEVLALADRLGARILEVGIRWNDDDASRVSASRDLWAVLREWRLIHHNLRLGVYEPLGQAR